MTGTPDHDGLEDFSHSRERHLTEFFVGREQEIGTIRRAVDVVARRHQERHPNPGEDGAILITGVPGAGKTSLMSYLRNSWSDSDGDGPIGVAVGLSDLASPEGLAWAVRRKLRGGVGEVFSDRIRTAHFSVFGTGGGIGVDRRRADTDETDRPLVLFIDEIQEISDDRALPEVRLLRDLHLGTPGSPIQPVLAGLAHSEDRLREVGMSRISPILPLGGLTPVEARQSATMFLDTFKVAGDRTGWPERISRWSDGWPLHLHNTLRALAGELARCGGDLDRADRVAVKRRAAASRLDYYGRRTAGVLAEHPKLLARIMDGMGPVGMTKAETLHLIREQSAEEGIEVLHATAVFGSMLAKGLIQASGTEEYVCPIPSMRSWCAARAGGRLHRLAMAGETEAARDHLTSSHDPDVTDPRGRTPLHVAAEENWPELVQVLLDAGANTAIIDRRQFRPADVAPPGSRAAKLLVSANRPTESRHLLRRDAADWLDDWGRPLDALRRLGGMSDGEILDSDAGEILARLEARAREAAAREGVLLQGDLTGTFQRLLNVARERLETGAHGRRDSFRPSGEPDNSPVRNF